jgi:hypothetical protein
MKTTVEIADDLLRKAKKVANAERTTLRALIEEGLRLILASRGRRERFTLRDEAVSGKGTQAGVAEGNWDEVRDLIYRGRGS